MSKALYHSHTSNDIEFEGADNLILDTDGPHFVFVERKLKTIAVVNLAPGEWIKLEGLDEK